MERKYLEINAPDKDPVPRIYKELYQFNNKNTNQLIGYFLKRIINGQ